jgi:hypothetical protein
MQRQATTTEAPQPGAPDASELHFRDQGEPNDGGARNDATTLAFEGLMKVSGEDDLGGDPYNRTGRFKRTVR